MHEMDAAMLNIRGNSNHICLLGLKKHLIITGQYLERDFKYFVFLESNILKVSIDAAASICLNNFRTNRMPMFFHLSQNLLLLSLRICLFSENSNEFEHFKDHLKFTICHHDSCPTKTR